MFECQCLKLQKIKGARSSYGGSEILIVLHVKQVSQQLSQAVSENPNSNEENKRGQEDLEESHRTAVTKLCDVIEKKIHLRSKNYETFCLV